MDNSVERVGPFLRRAIGHCPGWIESAIGQYRLDRHADRLAGRITVAGRQVGETDTVAFGHQDRAFDCMAELADVAWPLVRAQHVQRGTRNELYILAEQPVEVLDKMSDEGGD